jgi:hypothetical protein
MAPIWRSRRGRHQSHEFDTAPRTRSADVPPSFVLPSPNFVYYTYMVVNYGVNMPK